MTDANLVLGRLSPGGLLGGSMAVDAGLARRVIEPLAERLGFAVERTAAGILDIVVSNMVRAIRTVSVERGHDPRSCALMPFGGAGPLHAREVAARLGVREVLVPPAPGIMCAHGLLVSDLKEDFVASEPTPLDPDGRERLAARARELAERAWAWFEEEGVPEPGRTMELALDARYRGQNFELTVPLGRVSAGESDPLPDAATLRERFLQAHELSYGYSNPEDPAEVVNVRLTARGELGIPPPVPRPPATEAPAASGERDVWFGVEAPVPTPVYERDALAPGHVLDGPAMVEQLDATTPVHPGDRARVDPWGNLLIELGGKR